MERLTPVSFTPLTTPVTARLFLSPSNSIKPEKINESRGAETLSAD